MKLCRLSLLWCLVVLLALSSALSDGELSAQFNVRIGYSLGVVSPASLNEILNQHDSNRAKLYDEYSSGGDLGLVYGISLGGRYKIGKSAVELTWENMGRKTSSTGFFRPEPPLEPSANIEEFQFALNMLMLTYETNFGLLGIGSSIGQNFLSIKEIITNGKLPLLGSENERHTQYFARFNLAFNFFGNNTVAFAIKPFIQIGLTDIDLSSLASYLHVQSEETFESFPVYGLSFAFYNGRQ